MYVINKKWTHLLIWIVSFELIGYYMGYLTRNNIIVWYATLNKSSLTPPGYVFSIVWSSLYCLLAVIGWMLSHRLRQPTGMTAFILFAVQTLMNWAWTPLFFQLHWIGVSFIWLVMLCFVNIALIMSCYQRARIISLMLMPYLCWLMFASYLNGMIWLLN